MLPAETLRSKQRLDDKIQCLNVVLTDVENNAVGVDFAKMQTIAANYIAVAASGLFETGVQEIFYEFTRHRSNPQVLRFVRDRLKWNTTLDCNKIDTLLDRFDSNWKGEFREQTSAAQQAAIDSLQTLRNDVAHGKHNGTGYVVVMHYYRESMAVLKTLAKIVNR